MNIEIECTPTDAALLFDSPTLTHGMVREVPGGSIRLNFKVEKRSGIHADAFPVTIILTLAGKIAGKIAIGMAVRWLCDSLKSHKRTRIRINRKQIVEVTQAEAIIKVITEEEIVEE